MLEQYRYLDTSDGANSTESTDSNGITVYTLDISTSWNSDTVGALRDRYYEFITTSVGGSGTLTAQYSFDGITWDTVTDDAGNDVTWTVSSNTTWTFTVESRRGAMHRFSIDGSNSAGNITIKVLGDG